MTFEKRNHHYVPQFWQRGFRDQNNQLFGRFGSDIKQVSTRAVMTGDWIYTVFDDQWNPSDSVEDSLSAIEGTAAKLFQRITVHGSASSAEDRNELCTFLAYQACRHPDVMGRGYRLGKDFGKKLAQAHNYSLPKFINEISACGISTDEATDMYHTLLSRTPDQLAAELDELNNLSPQNSQLPEQDALRAQPIIFNQLQNMSLTLLDVPPGCEFVLGDTPVPQQDLHLGFSVPLSKYVAVLAETTYAMQIVMSRRTACVADVNAINRIQFSNSLQVVVGSSEAILNAL